MREPEVVDGDGLTGAQLDPVVINPIVVGGDASATASFQQLADGSKGQLFTAANADEVVRAIEEAVTEFSLAPVASADGPYTGAPGDEITFTGAGSFDPDGAIAEYAWDFNNDGTVDERGPSPVVLHAYAAPYAGLASLTVTAADGGTATATAEVSVTADGRLPAPPTAPRSVTVAAAGADTVTLSWRAPADVGDGPVSAYRVYRKDGAFLGLLPADTTSITLHGVPTGIDISFELEALNEFGVSPRAARSGLKEAEADRRDGGSGTDVVKRCKEARVG